MFDEMGHNSICLINIINYLPIKNLPDYINLPSKRAVIQLFDNNHDMAN